MSIVKKSSMHQVANTRRVLTGTYPKKIRKFAVAPKWLDRAINLFFPTLIILITVSLAILNHVPNTWLTGWDTLHPEFNFPLNLQRVLLGVWRQDQGLGTVAVHAHIVELPRILILWLWSLFIPVHLLRYSYVSLCLMLGPLGIYFLTNQVLKKTQVTSSIARLASFTAALWYIFNLGTLQQFILPFEMFPTNYAANGWLFYLAIKYLETKKSSVLWWLGLVNFFASSFAYSFISWYVYYGALGLFLFTSYLAAHKSHRQIQLKSVVSTLLVVLTVNIYWLLPNLYFVINHAWHVPLAKNNQIISDEIFYHNKEFGTLADTITMKNHLFNWKIKDGVDFVPLMKPYTEHLRAATALIPYLFFILIVLGIASSLAMVKSPQHRHIYGLGFIPVVVLAFLAFLTLNPPLELPFDFIREHISIAKEGLRNPFIKFNILLMLGYAVFCGVGMAWLLTALSKIKKLKILVLAIPIFAWVTLVYFGLPFFQGHLIDHRVQLAIPNEYFHMFNWFDQQSAEGRILVLPAPDFWAWDYHTWGYQGAGWMWFGLKQPFLSRDSDRWNPYNEEAYREISQAVNTQNWTDFQQLLAKYQIKWIIFDQTVTSNNDAKDKETLTALNQYFNNNHEFTVKKFSDSLAAYGVNAVDDQSSSLHKIASYSVVNPGYFWQNTDAAYQQLGTYISTSNQPTQEFFYPFRDVLTSTNRVNPDVLSWDQSNVYLHLPKKEDQFSYSLANMDSITGKLFYQQTSTDQGELAILPMLPGGNNQDNFQSTKIGLPLKSNHQYYLSINKQIVEIITTTNEEQELSTVSFNLTGNNTLRVYDGSISSNFKISPTSTSGLTNNCGASQTGSIFETKVEADSFTLKSQGATVCFYLPFSNQNIVNYIKNSPQILTQISFNTESASVKTNSFCLLNNQNNVCDNSQTEFTIYSNDAVNKETQVLAELNNLDIKNEFLLYSFTSQNLPEPESVTYQNVETKLFLPIFDQSLTLVLPDDLSRIPITESNQVLAIPLPKPSTLQKIAQASYPAPSCGSDSRAILKRNLKKETNLSFIEYSAQQGQTCDGFSFPDLDQKYGYILNIASRNKNGLSARMCIKRIPDEYCDFYTALGNQKDFVTESFLLPPLGTKSGYNVSFTNFAPGSFAAVNDISSIEFVPFNYEIIDSIHSQPSVSGNGINKSLVLLNQSFEPNMKLFWQKNRSFSVVRDQVLVNNWANGWIINNDEIIAKENAGYRLIAFFLPNLLELTGLVLGGGCLLILILKTIFHKKN